MKVKCIQEGVIQAQLAEKVGASAPYLNRVIKRAIKMAGKYSVNDAVWIATALMAAEKYSENKSVSKEEMYFKQADIVKQAQTLTENTVDAARVSWWVNADAEKHTQNYLRADLKSNESARRLSMIDEFPEKTYPENLDLDDVLEMGEQLITMEELLFFVREQYPSVIKKQNNNVRGWLLTWNPENWTWKNYEKICVETKNGKKVVESWTCSSKQPMLGDEVFLMKSGTQPRGIIAHGYVVKEAYDAPHYDLNKAAEGVVSNHIDVEFDWIQNIEKNEGMILQNQLKEKYPQQTWSPMGSGIEIRQPILNALKGDWKKLIVNEAYELKEALESKMINEKAIEQLKAFRAGLNGVQYAKNMILYGPPGTGKTYNTVVYAVAIIEKKAIEDVKAEAYDEVYKRYNQYKEDGLVAFTTFHQSYGYEEFIEGIKPVIGEGSEGIGYTIEDGVFKAFCESTKMPNNKIVDHNAKIWKVVLQSGNLVSTNTVKFECFNEGKIMYDWKTKEEHAGTYTFSQITHFQEKVNVGDIVVSYAGAGTDIDAIGIVTGDAEYDDKKPSFRWSRSVDWLEVNLVRNIKELNGNKYLDNAQLQPLKRVSIAELLKLVEPKTFAPNDKNYVFIIDEINRGNISKIFGELSI